MTNTLDNVTAEIKNIIGVDTYDNLVKSKLSSGIKHALASNLASSDIERAYLALHMYYDDLATIGLATSAEAGDVSVDLDNSFFDALPPQLKALASNLNNTPYGRKLLLELLQDSSGDGSMHVGSVFKSELGHCGGCGC